MASVSGLVSTCTSSIRKIQEQTKTASEKVRNINNSWRGTDEEAFQEAYRDLNKNVEKVTQQYMKVKVRIESLQSSIDKAERDKQEKRRLKSKRS